MGTQKFLLQGFTSDNHLDALQSLFSLPDIEKVIVSVAFLNKAGVDLLSSALSSVGSKTDVFAGIRNDITSRQGLHSLMQHGAKVHYVDTGARHVIFHPKIYFARTKKIARMVLGSANLTPGGLNNNIEASVTFELDLDNPDDCEMVDSIEAGFASLTNEYPGHIVLLNVETDLEKLQEEGRLIDEASSSPPRTVRRGSARKTDRLSRIKLKVVPIRGEVKRPKVAQAVPQTPVGAATTHAKTPPIASAGAELMLVWQSKPLVERDLSIPSGANTHATGSINLDKGLLEASIDHRHYFRDEVFSTLNWKTSKAPAVDEAFANFGLIVKGIEHGEFKLRIGHTTSTTSQAYLQRNAMTRLSWGPMKEFVSRKDLIDRTMSLYRHVGDDSRFVIEID